MSYNIRLVIGSVSFLATFACSASLVETVEPCLNMFQVNNKETRTTLSTLFWFLIVIFEQVLNIIVLHINSKLLLEILK